MPTAAFSLMQEISKQSRQGIVLEIANALFVQDKFQVLRCALPLPSPHTAHVRSTTLSARGACAFRLLRPAHTH